MRGTIIGIDILKENLLFKFNLKWEILKCITTDDGKNIYCIK